MNDGPADIGIKNNFNNPAKPILGVALPVTGIVAFLDHNWNSKFSTSIGYSLINVTHFDGAAGDAFKKGDYAIVNLLYNPVERVMMGLELQYGKRTNFELDFTSDILKLQFSCKYNFSHMFYKDKK